MPCCRACERCGQPTTGRFCAFCRARAQILGERLGPHRGCSADGSIETWWSSSPMRSCPPRSTGERRERVRAGRARDARGSARSHVPDDVAGGRDLSHAQRHAAARRSARQARRHARGDVEGHGDDGVPPALRGLRVEDASRRAGGVSEGPRPDHDVRGHLPGLARAGGGDRLRSAHDRAVPVDRARRARRLVRRCARIIAIKRSRTSKRSSGSSPISSNCEMEISRTFRAPKIASIDVSWICRSRGARSARCTT